MAKEYTTKVAIENYLMIDIDASFSSQITEWIKAVSEFIRLETNRDWLADGSATPRYFNGNGYQDLRIDDFIGTPVVEVGEDFGTGLVTTTDFVSDPINETSKHTIILKNTDFPKGVQNVKVTAKWGYAEAVPEDIKQVATILASALVLAGTNQDGEISSEKIGNYQVTYKNDTHKDDAKLAMDILQKRRVYAI